MSYATAGERGCRHPWWLSNGAVGESRPGETVACGPKVRIGALGKKWTTAGKSVVRKSRYISRLSRLKSTTAPESSR
ncbi:hypothetical protein [Pantoea ananatis]|uniref:hypothetical protein n=1 Tax=Pantoea ananas TaxID=553 RepID=UPI0021F7ADC7|nr:hypothetical protein [Pantoea ananatis]